MKRPIIPILVAVGLALLAGVLVFWYANSAEERALDEQAAVSVLVTTGDVLKGTTLSAAADAGLIESTQVSDKLAPATAIASIDGATGSLVATSDIPAGQILLSSSFGSEVVVPAGVEIPSGLMALSVTLGDPQKVGSFLRPGSYIAVFDTMTTTSPENPNAQPEVRTRLLLDRVQVLAIGAVTAESGDGVGPEDWSNTLVTVAVDQTQAEKLVHGVQTGALYLALLSDDTTLKPSEGVTNQTVFE